MVLDFSNTVALFGIYEPVDLIQYEFSLGLGFYATLPVRSPHAVHEEFYYRDLIEQLATSTTCSGFVESIPLNFIDLNPPTQHSGLLYSTYFASKIESIKMQTCQSWKKSLILQHIGFS